MHRISTSDQVRPLARLLRTAVVPAVLLAILLTVAIAGLAVSAPAPVPVAQARFGWPLASPHPVLRGFEAPAGPYGAGHRGVDLTAEPGRQVLAAGAGLVVFAGQVAGRGVVSIDHDGGLRTTYEPVTASVAVGTRVYLGDVIGVLGPIDQVMADHPGCAAVSACLHWGVRRDAEYLDPLSLLAQGRVRLKPWEGR